jgi:hypothetical protein
MTKRKLPEVNTPEDLNQVMTSISDELLKSMRLKMEREMEQAANDFMQLDTKHQFFFGTSYMQTAIQKALKARGIEFPLDDSKRG